jgi:hypothetical protein
MEKIFRKGDRVQLTPAARATGRGPGAGLGTVCVDPNPGAKDIKILWDRHGSRRGLYYDRDLIQPAASGNKA